MYIGVGMLFCVTLPVVIRYGIGVRICAPSMPLPSRAEHEVVARRAPRGLLGDLDVGHAVLGEEALLLGDDQRRRVGQRDEAERRLLHFRPGRLRDVRPKWKAALHRSQDSRRTRTGFKDFDAG